MILIIIIFSTCHFNKPLVNNVVLSTTVIMKLLYPFICLGKPFQGQQVIYVTKKSKLWLKDVSKITLDTTKNIILYSFLLYSWTEYSLLFGFLQFLSIINKAKMTRMIPKIRKMIISASLTVSLSYLIVSMIVLFLALAEIKEENRYF